MRVLLNALLVHGTVLRLAHGTFMQGRTEKGHVLGAHGEAPVQVASGVALPELLVHRQYDGFLGGGHAGGGGDHVQGWADRMMQVSVPM